MLKDRPPLTCQTGHGQQMTTKAERTDMHGRSVSNLQEIFSHEPSHFFSHRVLGGSKQFIPVALNLQFQGPSCELVGGRHNTGASFPCCYMVRQKGLY